MKKNQKFIFSLILLSVAAIGLRSFWTNSFTTVVMVVMVLLTIYAIIKDMISRRK
ncbi:hypothetical protein BAPNAU_2956 [Bacillus velezensis NAU-B3]|nr:hypothetical protein BAPNAU_2956 [Bacillus velezensis NAU-B3]